MGNSNRTTLASLIVLGTLVLITTAVVFQPWKLFIDTEVQEEIPTIQQTPKSTINPTRIIAFLPLRLGCIRSLTEGGV
ncbi:MAG: hypothetical protein EB103_06455, partial [Actinobacteria bacterium]|nr:hypothetical protein [Actinomycetota bacterium]